MFQFIVGAAAIVGAYKILKSPTVRRVVVDTIMKASGFGDRIETHRDIVRRPSFEDLFEIDNTYELVNRTSSRIEKFLKDEYSATGKGIHECVSSIEDQLTQKEIRLYRKIATLRNKVVHEEADIDIVDFKNTLLSLKNADY